jgi:hypothetical protein
MFNNHANSFSMFPSGFSQYVVGFMVCAVALAVFFYVYDR